MKHKRLHKHFCYAYYTIASKAKSILLALWHYSVICWSQGCTFTNIFQYACCMFWHSTKLDTTGYSSIKNCTIHSVYSKADAKSREMFVGLPPCESYGDSSSSSWPQLLVDLSLKSFSSTVWKYCLCLLSGFLKNDF